MKLWPWTKTVVARGNEEFHYVDLTTGKTIPNSTYFRQWVEYEIINHWTGSTTIKREYLN